MSEGFVIPPELWTLGGVLMGTLIPAFLTMLGARSQAQHESNKALIDAMERRIVDLERMLQKEAERRDLVEQKVKALEAEASAHEKRASQTQNQARQVLSIALSHISRLESHIEARTATPAPQIPNELRTYADALLWSSPQVVVPAKPTE